MEPTTWMRRIRIKNKPLLLIKNHGWTAAQSQESYHATHANQGPGRYKHPKVAAFGSVPNTLVGRKDRLAPPLVKENNVVEATGEMNARFTCHVGNIAELVNMSTWKPDKGLFNG